MGWRRLLLKGRIVGGRGVPPILCTRGAGVRLAPAVVG